MHNMFEIRSSVLCDEVREEKNGKQILIGVYLSSILVPDFPAKIPLTLWIQVYSEETGKYSGDIRVLGTDESVLLRGQCGFEIKNSGIATVSFPKMPLELQKEGKLSFQWNFGWPDWQTIKEMDVFKQPGIIRTQTTVSEQPSEKSPSAAQE